MRTMDTPLGPGERELFRREKLQVVANTMGGLIVNTATSPEGKVYVGPQEKEVFIEDGDVRIIAVQMGIFSSVIYQEIGSSPVFIDRNGAFTSEPIKPITQIVQ